MEGEPETTPIIRKGASSPLARIPTDAQFELMLQSADGAEGLRDLRKLMAAAEAVAKQCDIAFEEMLRLAVNKLKVERALGVRLAQDVKHGGLRSRSPRVTLVGGLPEGVTKQQAAKYRKLASVPDEAFETYLKVSKEKCKLPTSAGARRFQAAPVARAARVARKAAGIVLPAEVLECLGRILEVDVLVGPAKLPAVKCIPYQVNVASLELRGTVFVSDCQHPEAWLSGLAALRAQAVVDQVVVALRAQVWEEWFAMLRHGWRCCFLRGRRCGSEGVVLAHHGARGAAFLAAFGELGWTGVAG